MEFVLLLGLCSFSGLLECGCCCAVGVVLNQALFSLSDVGIHQTRSSAYMICLLESSGIQYLAHIILLKIERSRWFKFLNHHTKYVIYVNIIILLYLVHIGAVVDDLKLLVTRLK